MPRQLWLLILDDAGRPLAGPTAGASMASPDDRRLPRPPDLSAACRVRVPVEGVPVEIAWQPLEGCGGAAQAVAFDADGEARAAALVLPGLPHQGVAETKAVAQICQSLPRAAHLYAEDRRPLIAVPVTPARPGQAGQAAYFASGLLWAASAWLEQLLGPAVSDRAPASPSRAPADAPEAALALPDESDADAAAPFPAAAAG